MFSGICKWRGAGLPSLVAEARGWEANARKAVWEQESRTREPAAFLPNGGLREEPPGWGAKLPEAGRLVPESLSSLSIPPAPGLCRVYGFLCVLRLQYEPPIKFTVFFLLRRAGFSVASGFSGVWSLSSLGAACRADRGLGI